MSISKKLEGLFLACVAAAGMTSVADPSVTITGVASVEPWDGAKGTVSVDYSLAGIDAETAYKVAFDITANGVTRGVTNAAVPLAAGAQTQMTIDTTALFGAETVAHDAKVAISLVADMPPAPFTLSSTAPAAGSDYMIVAESEGGYYALDNTENGDDQVQTCTKVFPTDGTLVCPDGCCYVFTAVTAKDTASTPNEGVAFLQAGSEDQFLHLNSSKIRIATRATNGVFEFDSGEAENTFTMSALQNGMGLSFNGTKFISKANSMSDLYFYAGSAGASGAAVATAEATFLLGVTEVTLATGTGYGYVVSNETEAVEIAPTVAGGTTYALPFGARVGIYCVAQEGYRVVGTNPYVIDEVTGGTEIGAGSLPTAMATPDTDLGGDCGIWAKVDETTQAKYIEFTSIDVAAGTVTFEAAGVVAPSAVHCTLLVCEELGGTRTSIPAMVVATSETTGTATADFGDATALFIVGIGPAAAAPATFTLSSTVPAAGSDYMIVAESGGRYYALDNTENDAGQVLTCTEVFPEDGTIVCPDGCNCVFTAVTAKDTASTPNEGVAFLQAGSEDQFLHLNSGKIRIATRATNGVFEFGSGEAENTFTMYALQNGMGLSFNGTKFISKANSMSDLYFYVKD